MSEDPLCVLEFRKALQSLNKLVSEAILDEVQCEGSCSIAVTFSRRLDGRRYLLRITCGVGFPNKPPDFKFVNPKTGADDGPGCWPEDGNNAFKRDEDPRWMCIPGTSSYHERHGERPYHYRHDSIAQAVMHVAERVNGWR